MEPRPSFNSQQEAAERRLQATNHRQQRRRIRDSKTSDEGSMRTRRRSNDMIPVSSSEPASTGATQESQMWDIQMQNAFLRHQLAMTEQQRVWLEDQLQKCQAVMASCMAQKRQQQPEVPPQPSFGRSSTSSSSSDSDQLSYPATVPAGAQEALPPMQQHEQLPLDDFDLFDLDLLPDVPEGLESVDQLTAHLPLGV